MLKDSIKHNLIFKSLNQTWETQPADLILDDNINSSFSIKNSWCFDLIFWVPYHPFQFYFGLCH